MQTQARRLYELSCGHYVICGCQHKVGQRVWCVRGCAAVVEVAAISKVQRNRSG